MSEVFFANLLTMPALLLDRELRLRHFTSEAERILNLSPFELGLPIESMALDLELPNLKDLAPAVLERGESREMEIRAAADRWYRLQVKPCKDSNGVVMGMLLAFLDITEFKQREQEKAALLERAQKARDLAEKMNREKDLFLASLSHEMRTPLAVIYWWAQVLRTGKLDAAYAKRGIQTIEENAKMQERLINDLLDISRINAGKLKLDLEEVDPAAKLQAILHSIRFMADAKMIQFEIHVDPTLGRICIDPTRMQQIIWNLLHNAIKFSPRNSSIAVSMRRVASFDGDVFQLKVQDWGRGITSDFLPHVFESFSQADSSSSPAQGLGLGLYIVRNLVELHGGTLKAESGGIGQGTTFTIEMPAAVPVHTGLSPAKRPSREYIRGESLSHLRVLLIDDDFHLREAFAVALESYGATVKTVESAEAALARPQSFDPDVVVCDLTLPDEDGYALIKRYRELEGSSRKQVPFVALTACAGPDVAKRAYSAGFHTHVTKPIDIRQLVDVIAGVAQENTV